MAKKVLVVEDDSNIAELLRLYLEKDGFDVFLAADGGEGIRRAPGAAAGSHPARHHAAGRGRLGRLLRGPEDLPMCRSSC